MFTRVVLVTMLALLTEDPTSSQERFSFFAPSSPESVDRMLTLAKLQDDDVVVDLGSGNGLIPLTAARMNRRLRGLGVEIDPKLVEESNQRARSEGLADRVRFEHRNAFDVDLDDATVVTMWLFPELMRLLRPIILERATPGTRVLTSTWNLGAWQADKVDLDGETAIYMWIVPARVAGAWKWELSVAGRRFRYSSIVEQHFQMVEGVARTGDRREVLEGMTLRGADIAFAFNHTRSIGTHAAPVQRQGGWRSDRRHRDSHSSRPIATDDAMAGAAQRAFGLLRPDRHGNVSTAVTGSVSVDDVDRHGLADVRRRIRR